MGSWSYSETFGGGGWKGYENYIATKNQRINEQLKKQIQQTSHESDKKVMIFEKCVFWLDGRTRIAEERLKELMVLYGGQYEASTLSRVTHVVADNLALGNQRWRQIRDKGTKQFSVVTSEWIVACVEKGYKIPESYFTPSCLKDTVSGFGSIFRFMTYASKDESSLGTVCQSELHTETNEDTTNTLMLDNDLKNDNDTEKEMKSSSPILCTDDCNDFVVKFFNASRLHFIGRWRERLALKFRIFPFAPLLPEWTSEKSHVSSNDSVLKRFIVSKSMKTTVNHSKVSSTILHIDFDAFFVSVALKKYPHLLNRPVAVCHGTGSNSGSEIASCNYVARQFGVEKGMWLRNGKQLCADLHVLPYDFQGIEKASLCMMDVLTNVTSRVLPVSCDEAYLQLVGDYEMTYCQEIAEWIQQEVYKRTGCSVSIGIAPNLLLAKIATGYAKPKSSQQVKHQSVFQAKPPYKTFMASVPLSSLPGIGQRALDKLNTRQLEICQDVIERCTLHELQRLLGEKQGSMCYSFCFGCDPRPFPAFATFTPDKSRSLTVSINWGIRLTTEKGVQNLLFQMSEECERRLAAEELGTCDITLKVLKRSPDAPFEPSKYGGCGMCDELSQSIHEVPTLLVNAKDIYQYLYQLWIQPAMHQNVSIPDLRGVTICMMKLQKKNKKKKESSQQSLQQFQQNMKNNEKITKDTLSLQNNSTSPFTLIDSDDDKKEAQPSTITRTTPLHDPLEGDPRDQENYFREAVPEEQKIDYHQFQSSVLCSTCPSMCENALQPTHTKNHEVFNNKLKDGFFDKGNTFKKSQVFQVTPRKRSGGGHKQGKKKSYKDEEASQAFCMFDKKKKKLQPTLLELMKKVSSSSSSMNNLHKRHISSPFASSINKRQCNAVDIIDIDEISSHNSPHSPLPDFCRNDTIHSAKHLASPLRSLSYNSNESNNLTVDQYIESKPEQFHTFFTKSSKIQEKISDLDMHCQSHSLTESQKKDLSPNINTLSLNLPSPSVPPSLDVQSPCVPPFPTHFQSDLCAVQKDQIEPKVSKQHSTIVHVPKSEPSLKKKNAQNQSVLNNTDETQHERVYNTIQSPDVKPNLFDTIIQMKNLAKETEQHFVDVHVQLSEDCISISDSSYSEVELTYCPNLVRVCIPPTPTLHGQSGEEDTTQEKIRDLVTMSSLGSADILPYRTDEKSLVNKGSAALLHYQSLDDDITRDEIPNSTKVSSLEPADKLRFETEGNSFANENIEASLHRQYSKKNKTWDETGNWGEESSLESSCKLFFETKENSFVNENIETLLHCQYDEENKSRDETRNWAEMSPLESADMLRYRTEEKCLPNENVEEMLHYQSLDDNMTPDETGNWGERPSLESAYKLHFETEENSFSSTVSEALSHNQQDKEKNSQIKTLNGVGNSFVNVVGTPGYSVVESPSLDFSETTLPCNVCYTQQASCDDTSMSKKTILNRVHLSTVSEASITNKDIDRKVDTDDATVSDSYVVERAVVGMIDVSGLCSAIEHRARMFQPGILDYTNEPRYTHCVCGGADETFSKIIVLEDSFTSPFSMYISWLSKACWMCVACTFVEHYTPSSPLMINLLITQFGTTLIIMCFLLNLEKVSPESPRIQSFPVTLILEEIWGISTCFSLHRDNDIRNTFLLGLLSLTKNWSVFNDCIKSMISPSIYSSKHPLAQKVLRIQNSLQQVTMMNSKTINEHVLINSFHQLHDCLEKMVQQDKCLILSIL